MVLGENKADIVCVLLTAKSLKLLIDLVLVTSGGFENLPDLYQTDVKCPTCHSSITRRTLGCWVYIRCNSSMVYINCS